VVFDEKNYVYHENQRAGGNGINAGIIAHNLGSQVMLTGFIGGSSGETIAKLLNQVTIDHKFIKIVGQTRINITISNKADHRQTRLSFPGPIIQTSEKIKLHHFLKKLATNDIVLLGGSLPPGIDFAYLILLIKEVKKRKAYCFVDMPGKFLKEIIYFKPDFIKPNLVEFQSLVGKKVTTIKTVLPIAKKLLEYIPFICISSIEGGALLVSKDKTWFGKIPRVKIHSTVGAGDSMVGAMANLWNKKPHATGDELLRLGLAASCATLTERGLTLGTKKSILNYQPQIILKEIK